MISNNASNNAYLAYLSMPIISHEHQKTGRIEFSHVILLHDGLTTWKCFLHSLFIQRTVCNYVSFAGWLTAIKLIPILGPHLLIWINFNSNMNE